LIIEKGILIDYYQSAEAKNSSFSIFQFSIERKTKRAQMLKTTTKKTTGLPDWFECLLIGQGSISLM